MKEILYEKVGKEAGEKIIAELKKEILQEIRCELLPVSIVLSDLREVREKNKVTGDLIESILLAPLAATFDDMGKEHGLSREHVYRRLLRASRTLTWLRELLALRGKYLRPNTGRSPRPGP